MSASGPPSAGQDEADNGFVKTATSSAASAGRHRTKTLLPTWVTSHFNFNDLKVVFRCWVAVWVAVLLVLIDPVLQNFGISTFFAGIVLYITPPAGTLTVYLFGSLSLLLGMCLAWAWGLLSMKAAFAARPDADTQALLSSLQQQAATIANQTGQPAAAVAQQLVYEGHMLDARVVVVFFVMSCAFIYVLARLRYANSKLILLQLFGTIVTDVFILSGPILTKFNATLAQVLVKPGAVGVGLGAACSVLIFPRSTSSVVLSQMEQLTRLLDTPLRMTRQFLNDDGTSSGNDAQSSKAAVIGMLKAMEPGLAFLPLDFSRGRWNSEDIKSLYIKIREATAASLFLIDFHVARVSTAARAKKLAHSRNADSKTPQDEKSVSEVVGSALSDRTEISSLVEALKSPEESSVRPELVSTLRDTTANILQTTSQATVLAAEAIHIVNTNRWLIGEQQKSRLNAIVSELGELRASLEAARATCITETNDGVIRAHAELFDEHGQLRNRNHMHPLALNGIILSMVLEERIIGAASSMESVLEHVAQLLQLRTEQRIWLPSRIRYAFTWLTSDNSTVAAPASSTVAAVDPDDMRHHTEEVQRRLKLVRKGIRDPALGPVKRQGALTKAIVGAYNWLFNPGGIYALRIVVVTIALSIPAVLPSTAGLFYREKGIWAVIMSQTCLLLYMADFTFSLLCRGAGTVIGGVIALVAWYAGSGDGTGNAYGLGATTAVASLVLIWCRIFLPVAFLQACVMAGATFVLIIGFSWDQYHITSYGLPGLGYTAFWKRLVTVLIGFAAAFIVQIFPKPPSATRYVCKTLANHVRTLNDHYALLVSQWGHPRPQGPTPAAAAAAEKMTLKVAETLLELTGPIALLRVEVSSLPFDQSILTRVREKCNVMNQCLGKLLVLSSTLPKHLQERLAQTAGLVDNQSVANLMSVLAIVETSLRTGSPLPQRLPVPLVETCFLNWFVHHERAELSIDLVRSEDYRRYCVAVSCYLRLLSVVDDLVEDLKGTVGETHVVHAWEHAV
ncbi:hypothetical protein AAL_04706 [Moelleriella libera RCEF 2490]|uniref:ER transporter 6TM N-terminal domain-containing protein n=1 Tax=Moelleriella libera RCEF 2490 TaxID=1081109 RepID=A0A168BLY0_9HYPO|nr:hypothetical protein AAL_04706 [Moelleriella libera RCEF 2490]